MLQGAPVRRDGRTPVARALDIAAGLADLCGSGLPLDAESIAAAVLGDAMQLGLLDIRTVEARLGMNVASLLHDLLRVREAGEKVELYDDDASRSVSCCGCRGWEFWEQPRCLH